MAPMRAASRPRERAHTSGPLGAVSAAIATTAVAIRPTRRSFVTRPAAASRRSRRARRPSSQRATLRLGAPGDSGSWSRATSISASRVRESRRRMRRTRTRATSAAGSPRVGAHSQSAASSRRQATRRSCTASRSSLRLTRSAASSSAASNGISAWRGSEASRAEGGGSGQAGRVSTAHASRPHTRSRWSRFETRTARSSAMSSMGRVASSV